MIDPNVFMAIQSQKLLDGVKQVKAIQKARANTSSVATYKERESVSGFRKIDLSTGESMYARYRSNALVEPDQVIPGYNYRNTDQSIGSIDIKPS